MMDVGYGMFFSDESVLTDVETEAGLLASLVVQDTPVEIASHMKGLSRLGLDQGMIQEIKTVSEEVVAFMRSNVAGYPKSKGQV